MGMVNAFIYPGEWEWDYVVRPLRHVTDVVLPRYATRLCITFFQILH